MPKTINEELLDAMVRHQTYLLRYSGHIRNRINNLLLGTEADLAEKIRDRLRTYSGLRTPVEWERLQRLQKQLTTIRMGAWDKAQEFLENEMVQLAYHEPAFLSNTVQAVLPVAIETTMPSTRMLRAIALSRPFDGRILKDWAATMAADDIRRIHSAIQVGMVAGETNETIARRVVGTRALKGSDGVTEIGRRQVNSIVRTAVMHVANSSRNEFFSENADIVAEEYFVATLDARTTPQCAANDGKRFPLGKGPMPPLHWGCRSLRIAALDGVLLGNRPAKPYTEKQLAEEWGKQNGLKGIAGRDDLPYGTKGQFDKWRRNRIRQLVGPIPANTSYNTWLKGQSVDFQNDTLGITKAKLFREGGLNLDKFVNRNGDELTLAQLAEREAAAFRAAGLDPDKYRPRA
jgi:SPP1 gp7 family putative phage head morphogenesis protein